LADRLKLSNERLERTYTYHTSYTSPCLKPSALLGEEYLFDSRLVRIVKCSGLDVLWHEVAAGTWQLVPVMQHTQGQLLLIY